MGLARDPSNLPPDNPDFWNDISDKIHGVYIEIIIDIRDCVDMVW